MEAAPSDTDTMDSETRQHWLNRYASTLDALAQEGGKTSSALQLSACKSMTNLLRDLHGGNGKMPDSSSLTELRGLVTAGSSSSNDAPLAATCILAKALLLVVDWLATDVDCVAKDRSEPSAALRAARALLLGEASTVLSPSPEEKPPPATPDSSGRWLEAAVVKEEVEEKPTAIEEILLNAEEPGPSSSSIEIVSDPTCHCGLSPGTIHGHKWSCPFRDRRRRRQLDTELILEVPDKYYPRPPSSGSPDFQTYFDDFPFEEEQQSKFFFCKCRCVFVGSGAFDEHKWSCDEWRQRPEAELLSIDMKSRDAQVSGKVPFNEPFRCGKCLSPFMMRRAVVGHADRCFDAGYTPTIQKRLKRTAIERVERKLGAVDRADQPSVKKVPVGAPPVSIKDMIRPSRRILTCDGCGSIYHQEAAYKRHVRLCEVIPLSDFQAAPEEEEDEELVEDDLVPPKELTLLEKVFGIEAANDIAE